MANPRAVLSASGLFTPAESISNDELVASFNEWVRRENARHAAAIAAGSAEALVESSSEFIVKASGIRSRYVVDRAGILDPDRMRPRLERRDREQPSILAEMAVAAGRDALARGGRNAAELDGVIVACSNLQRPYPAIAVEVQALLGAAGFAFDMNVACASAVFGIQTAVNAVVAGAARSVLVLCPEICTGHLNFRDRDSHFIFGDAAAAALVESSEVAGVGLGYEVLGTRLATQFSNHIRNEFGFLNRAEEPAREARETLFVQDGRQVFKEVTPLVAELLAAHLDEVGLEAAAVRRFWMHQANANMNHFILRRLLGAEPPEERAPIILDRYANTSSAGCLIAFHEHQENVAPGDVGVLSAFGAGYSAGSAILRRR